MKAIVINEFGGPEVLHQRDIETPAVGPGEVLIRLVTVGVNRFDITTRRGEIPYAAVSFPHILGVEGAGTVAAVGSDVTAFQIGDRVAPVLTISLGVCRHIRCYCQLGWDNICRDFDKHGLTSWGTYAEYVKASEHNVVHLPASLSFSDAATAMVATATAWELTISRTRLRQGATALVNAVGGAVGSAAVQIARLTGARVIASAGSDNKLEVARQLGADEVINYAKEDITERVKELTTRRGVEVVVDHVGEEFWPAAYASLAPGGRYGICGVTTGYRSELQMGLLFIRAQTVFGVFMGQQEDLRLIVEMAGRGVIHGVISDTYPLQDAARAHRAMEEQSFFGKLILTID